MYKVVLPNIHKIQTLVKNLIYYFYQILSKIGAYNSPTTINCKTTTSVPSCASNLLDSSGNKFNYASALMVTATDPKLNDLNKTVWYYMSAPGIFLNKSIWCFMHAIW